MTITEIVAYTLFVTAGVAVLYSILIAVEVKKGVRFGKRFRQYLDQKVVAGVKRLGKGAEIINALYEQGSDEVEKDLIDPVTKPIVETQQQYLKLKTGEREIAYTGKRHASLHLRQITEMHNEKRKKKKKRRKKRGGKQGKHTPHKLTESPGPQAEQQRRESGQKEKQQPEQQPNRKERHPKQRAEPTPTPPQDND